LGAATRFRWKARRGGADALLYWLRTCAHRNAKDVMPSAVVGGYLEDPAETMTFAEHASAGRSVPLSATAMRQRALACSNLATFKYSLPEEPASHRPQSSTRTRQPNSQAAKIVALEKSMRSFMNSAQTTEAINLYAQKFVQMGENKNFTLSTLADLAWTILVLVCQAANEGSFPMAGGGGEAPRQAEAVFRKKFMDSQQQLMECRSTWLEEISQYRDVARTRTWSSRHQKEFEAGMEHVVYKFMPENGLCDEGAGYFKAAVREALKVALMKTGLNDGCGGTESSVPDEKEDSQFAEQLSQSERFRVELQGKLELLVAEKEKLRTMVQVEKKAADQLQVELVESRGARDASESKTAALMEEIQALTNVSPPTDRTERGVQTEGVSAVIRQPEEGFAVEAMLRPSITRDAETQAGSSIDTGSCGQGVDDHSRRASTTEEPGQAALCAAESSVGATDMSPPPPQTNRVRKIHTSDENSSSGSGDEKGLSPFARRRTREEKMARIIEVAVTEALVSASKAHDQKIDQLEDEHESRHSKNAATLSALHGELAQGRKDNQALELILLGMRKKMEELKKLLEDRGIDADVINETLKESGLQGFMDVQVTVYDRLYGDAVSRWDRQLNRWQQQMDKAEREMVAKDPKQYLSMTSSSRDVTMLRRRPVSSIRKSPPFAQSLELPGSAQAVWLHANAVAAPAGDAAAGGAAEDASAAQQQGRRLTTTTPVLVREGLVASWATASADAAAGDQRRDRDGSATEREMVAFTDADPFVDLVGNLGGVAPCIEASTWEDVPNNHYWQRQRLGPSQCTFAEYLRSRQAEPQEKEGAGGAGAATTGGAGTSGDGRFLVSCLLPDLPLAKTGGASGCRLDLSLCPTQASGRRIPGIGREDDPRTEDSIDAVRVERNTALAPLVAAAEDSLAERPGCGGGSSGGRTDGGGQAPSLAMGQGWTLTKRPVGPFAEADSGSSRQHCSFGSPSPAKTGVCKTLEGGRPAPRAGGGWRCRPAKPAHEQGPCQLGTSSSEPAMLTVRRKQRRSR